MTLLTKSVKEIQELLNGLPRPIGLVPTMGALHAGHISLINTSKQNCKTTVVSIFVNPLQFSPNEDFKQYPRDLKKDFDICKENKADIVFAPSIEEFYPDINKAKENLIIPPSNITGILCGKTREGHFNGVATAVKNLFQIVQPDISYWGQKDLQQYFIIQWLIKELNLPIKAELLATIREANGLAYSSRNRYLSEPEKDIAAGFYKSLKLAKENLKSGIFTIGKSILESLIVLSHFPEIKVEYFEARDKQTLEKIDEDRKNNFYFLIAGRVNNIRLIDNIEV